ncbi:MAG: hypothetical protein HY730_06015 [Candidatus Tectomicrobia bacterium]|uniref:Uncharacterized protein n=1 Tax=Tectimicrobiota bacterium TaxID=2528274 RepID=A0A933LQA3_UNCTE|nr:hypothetical protein [Candidatus Tectomicrobia bacterium]
MNRGPLSQALATTPNEARAVASGILGLQAYIDDFTMYAMNIGLAEYVEYMSLQETIGQESGTQDRHFPFCPAQLAFFPIISFPQKRESSI